MSAVYALSAFLMTLAGGAFALRYRKYLLYIMAFSAGLLIGVAFLDLLPEVVELAHREQIDIRTLMITMICGFLGIYALAPVAGALLANVIDIRPRIVAHQLAFFAGFLLYLGASDLLQRVHQKPRFALMLFTFAGLVTASGIVYVLEAVR